MTKMVRIENACNNNSKKIIVEVWDEDPNRDELNLYPTTTEEILYPTGMVTKTIHSTNYLVIREEDIT